ncbi:MAG: type III pantothenate kinase [candidate division Zixibacteria bacterium]|nr:type III pantothenate kinase [candidate division Zixibacteria bacterium]MBU1471493.1 type III pantothenate kinase [candidate division Zixibacteria bacterium]MBU2625523.1 type III pantothenate kinase [candidate division Zixibacteria bacterium]
MLLCIDIGNTDVVMGLFDNDKLIAQGRFATSNLRTSDECGIQAHHLVQRHHPHGNIEVDGVIISSVVPFLTPRMAEMSRTYLKRDPIILSSDLDIGLDIKVQNPHEVGADRLANAVAAINAYNTDLLIIDLGTATTFDVVTKEGEYVGGAIAPGLESASSGLVKKAAQLFSVEIAPPKHAIGTTTEESMKSGIFLGQVEMMNGMIIRMEAEFQAEFTIIITGGYGKIFAEHLDRDAIYDPDLTLQGLRIIYNSLA